MVKVSGIELNERETWFITAHTVSFLFNQSYDEIMTSLWRMKANRQYSQ